MLNADVTILADSVKGAAGSEELMDSAPQAFVMADTVKDQNANIMNLVFR